MKKLLPVIAILLTLALVLASCTFNAGDYYTKAELDEIVKGLKKDNSEIKTEYAQPTGEFEIIANGTYSYAIRSYTGLDRCVVIPSTYNNFPVTEVYGFYNESSLRYLVIPNTVEVIDSAFDGCYNLSTVVIPESVTSMKDAFDGCTSLTDIKYRGSQEQWEAINKGTSWIPSTNDYTITYNYTGD